MNILICFKVVPDLDMMSGDDWTVNSEKRVNTGFVKNILNCFDESALEMALKLSDYSEGFSAFNLTALTIGDKRSETYLKNLYALKFNKAVRIENNADVEFLPEVVSAVISQYVKEVSSQDVIIMGRQSGTGDNAKTPLLVAEMLGWPCITQVIKIEPDSTGSLKITNMVDDGILSQTVQTPCVLAIGNAPDSYIRVPTLKDKMKYGKTPIDVIYINSFNFDDHIEIYSQYYELKDLININNNREGTIIEGRTPAEKARKLFDYHLKERLEKL